jgi:hypothetical protein
MDKPFISDAANLPVRFTVGASVKSWRGGGHLVVAPGVAALELGPLLRRATAVERVIHTDPVIMMLSTRLAPPWINTSLLLSDDGLAGIASTWFGARARLKKALHQAGFVVDERKA